VFQIVLDWLVVALSFVVCVFASAAFFEGGLPLVRIFGDAGLFSRASTF
jgi:hypothetical protein